MIDLSIIIVSYNVKEYLKKCLASIFANQADLKLQVIVVDNASADRSVEMIKANFPSVEIIANQKNLGFAKANNQGLKQARAKYILALNPDTEIIGDCLPKMLELIKSNNQIGIAGCRHLNPDYTLQPSVRRFPTLKAIIMILFKLAKFFDSETLDHYLAKDFDYQKSQPADQVAGSFFLVRQKMLEQIGWFDEKFFIWFEEVDLCYRAKKAGWQVWYSPQASIIHYGGQSFAQKMTFKKQIIFFKSAWYYFGKHRQ
jgi:hypothetical protein